MLVDDSGNFAKVAVQQVDECACSELLAEAAEICDIGENYGERTALCVVRSGSDKVDEVSINKFAEGHTDRNNWGRD